MAEGFAGASMSALADKFGKGRRKTRGASVADRIAEENKQLSKIDGRSLRRTGRTEVLAARVKLEIKTSVYAYAERHELKLGEVVEMAVELLMRDEQNGKA